MMCEVAGVCVGSSDTAWSTRAISSLVHREYESISVSGERHPSVSPVFGLCMLCVTMGSTEVQ